MKVTVTKTTTDVTVEGEASEIREAMPSILHGAEPATPTAVTGGGSSAPLELEAAPPVTTPPPAPAAVVDDLLPHERVAAMDDWKPVAAEPADVPTRRFDRWEDVPVAHRVWNATKAVCHVSRTPNEPSDTYCGVDVGMFRDPNLEPLGGATVCGNCNRRIEEANRA